MTYGEILSGNFLKKGDKEIGVIKYNKVKNR